MARRSLFRRAFDALASIPRRAAQALRETLTPAEVEAELPSEPEDPAPAPAPKPPRRVDLTALEEIEAEERRIEREADRVGWRPPDMPAERPPPPTVHAKTENVIAELQRMGSVDQQALDELEGIEPSGFYFFHLDYESHYQPPDADDPDPSDTVEWGDPRPARGARPGPSTWPIRFVGTGERFLRKMLWFAENGAIPRLEALELDRPLGDGEPELRPLWATDRIDTKQGTRWGIGDKPRAPKRAGQPGRPRKSRGRLTEAEHKRKTEAEKQRRKRERRRERRYQELLTTEGKAAAEAYRRRSDAAKKAARKRGQKDKKR